MPNGMLFSLYVELLTCCSLVTMMRPKGLSNSSFYVLGLSIVLFIMLCDSLGLPWFWQFDESFSAEASSSEALLEKLE